MSNRSTSLILSLVPAEAGKARAEGLAFYKIAGRPKKSDFIRVYGKDGAKWTWEQRAKAVGLGSAKEVAEQFPAMLAAKTHKSVVVGQ